MSFVVCTYVCNFVSKGNSQVVDRELAKRIFRVEEVGKKAFSVFLSFFVFQSVSSLVVLLESTRRSLLLPTFSPSSHKIIFCWLHHPFPFEACWKLRQWTEWLFVESISRTKGILPFAFACGAWPFQCPILKPATTKTAGFRS